jgi:hypothetical protein
MGKNRGIVIASKPLVYRKIAVKERKRDAFYRQTFKKNLLVRNNHYYLCGSSFLIYLSRKAEGYGPLKP